MRFRDIPRYINDGGYRVNQSWNSLERALERYFEDGLDLDPDFQRGHVWNETQQRNYVEFILKGGVGCSNELRFNCPRWNMGDRTGPFVIVDGKQRLEAVRRFLRNDLAVFGHKFEEFTDRLPWEADFIFIINSLNTRKEVLEWYLQINTGGVVHTTEELDRVRKLLESA